MQKYFKLAVLYQPKSDKNAQKYEKVVKTTMLYSLKMIKNKKDFD